MKSYPGLNVVMYHYILKNNKIGNFKLKSLNIEKFIDQISSISKKNKIISSEEFKFKLDKKYKFNNEFILTFDDGYKCHYDIVKKVLDFKKIKGFFYPTCYPYRYKKLLDINKIHLILSKERNSEKLYNFTMNYLKSEHHHDYLKIKSKISQIKKNKSYDDEKTIIIKRILQSYLPEKIKSRILKILFSKILNEIDIKLINNFYLNINDIKKLHSQGHEIGLHGFNHSRYEFLSQVEQSKDLDKSKSFWSIILKNKKNWSICYPFGSFNNFTKKLLKKNNISFALTTKKGSNLNPYNNNLELRRWDTNDLF